MSFTIFSTKTGLPVRLATLRSTPPQPLSFREQSAAIRVAHALELAYDAPGGIGEYLQTTDSGALWVNDFFGRVSGHEAHFGNRVHVRWDPVPPLFVFDETDMHGVYELTNLTDHAAFM